MQLVLPEQKLFGDESLSSSWQYLYNSSMMFLFVGCFRFMVMFAWLVLLLPKLWTGNSTLLMFYLSMMETMKLQQDQCLWVLSLTPLLHHSSWICWTSTILIGLVKGRKNWLLDINDIMVTLSYQKHVLSVFLNPNKGFTFAAFVSYSLNMSSSTDLLFWNHMKSWRLNIDI